LEKPGFAGIEFGRGVQELARAIAESRPHLASAEHAAHVIEILEAVDRSAGAGGNLQRIESRFGLPQA
jgi:predicted dehydrogenase